MVEKEQLVLLVFMPRIHESLLFLLTLKHFSFFPSEYLRTYGRTYTQKYMLRYKRGENIPQRERETRNGKKNDRKNETVDNVIFIFWFIPKKEKDADRGQGV